MEIANKSLLKPVIERSNQYTTRDGNQTNSAITAIISKFGPSGSLKDTSIVLEQTKDVIPSIRSEIFFDLKYIICL